MVASATVSLAFGGNNNPVFRVCSIARIPTTPRDGLTVPEAGVTLLIVSVLIVGAASSQPAASAARRKKRNIRVDELFRIAFSHVQQHHDERTDKHEYGREKLEKQHFVKCTPAVTTPPSFDGHEGCSPSSGLQPSCSS